MNRLLIRCLTLGALLAPASAHAAQNAPLARVQVRYAGTLWVEAHFKRPHEIRPYQTRATYSADGRGRVRVDWVTWSGEDSTSATPETYLAAGDSIFHRSSPASTWSLLAGNERHLGWIQAAAGIPAELGRIVREQTDAKKGEFMFEESQFIYTEKRAHPRLGDVIDSVAYTYGGSDRTPTELLITLHELHHQWRLVAHLAGAPSDSVPDSLFHTPTAFEPPPAHPDSLVAEPTIVAIAPGLWAAEMEDIDSRSMIVEFADHLAIAEWALSSANGERLVDAARRRWPNKPVRYALFSHHHPHYLGGLRAAMAERATIVTTPGNKKFVQEIGTYQFTLQPDRLARAPLRPVMVRTFDDRIELADSTNQLVAINFGERSNHTDEFVVFWFPRAKLLFEAELGWINSADGKLRPTRRAATLLPWLAEQKLDVERLVQSWPMKGEEREVSRAKLEELVQASAKKGAKP